MGVQSFSVDDLRSLGRPQAEADVDRAIAAIQTMGFPVFNLDLIYGCEGQTPASWMETIERTLSIKPEEVYLYPLYVRELTGLGKTGRTPTVSRRELYLAARDALVGNGYQQHSMRLFRKQSVESQTDYCCQEDGMVGLGPGARSYTRSLHYSSDFAVGQSGVRKIISAFNARSDRLFAEADYGVELGLNEQQRRYVIKSLLRASGISMAQYESLFGSDVLAQFPQLIELLELGFAGTQQNHFRLNALGLSWSDTIGPWLYSPEVSRQMEAFELV